MRFRIYLLGALVFLSGCSVSTGLRKNSFSISQVAPSHERSLPEILLHDTVYRAPATAENKGPECAKFPAQKKKTGLFMKQARQKALAHMERKSEKLLPHIPVPYREKYTTATKRMRQKAELSTGCACLGIMLLACLLSLGISWLWKTLFGKAIHFYGLLIMAVVLTVLLAVILGSTDLVDFFTT